MRRFDELFAESSPLIIGQRHRRERPPVEGGRWPVSVVIFPDRDLAEHLDAITRQLIKLAGPGHFHTGIAGSAHLTVRALERFRARVPDGDPAVARYARALRAAAARTSIFSVTITGLTLTPGAVLAGVAVGADPIDALSAILAEELGRADDWLERANLRTFRHLSLLHFGADLAQPRELVDWVGDRRSLALGSMVVRAADLVRARHRRVAGGQLMHLEKLIESVPLTGS